MQTKISGQVRQLAKNLPLNVFRYFRCAARLRCADLAGDYRRG